jgi:hypothetical protein
MKAPPSVSAFDECDYNAGCTTGRGVLGQPLASENAVAVPQVDLGSSLVAKAGCGGAPGAKCPATQHDEQGYAAVIYVYAADLVLEQSSGPAVSDVGGELATASTIAGTSDVAFEASDPGSGVYEGVFAVDGKVVQRTVLDENGGRCVNVGGTEDGLAAFLYLQPCKGQVSVDVPFNTAGLSNGSHDLEVTVTDAAGNSAVVLDREVTVANGEALAAGGAANGADASPDAMLSVGWLGTHESHLRSGFGHVHTAVGRLTGPGGVPIAGAQIRCTSTAASAGARAEAVGCSRTDASGRFSLRLRASAGSQTLRFAYGARLGGPVVATRTLGLTVRAGVRLGVSPRVTSVGKRISFSGGLLGGQIPRGGKEVVLEARSPGGRWIEFDVVRTNAKGRFRSSYRFRLPGPVDYGFRALSEAEADYPYARGISNLVGVRER